MLTNKKKDQIVKDYEDWWEHQLERPIIEVFLAKTDRSKAISKGELLEMVYDYSIPEEEVVKAYCRSFDSTIYLGDAFPHFYMRSTGVLGEMLGQTHTIDSKRGTIWFEEMKGKELEEIHPKLTKDNKLFQRGIRLINAFQKELGDDVALGIPNLGGMMDIVESMRGANNSLMDLYDDPDEVIRLNNDIYEAYEFAYKNYIDEIARHQTLGYTGWTPLLSQKPYFISQCDFCCMIGPKQFDEFVKDTLAKEASLIERSFYHLDGPGAVKHLDTIINCGFDGIQWINGAGSKPLDDEAWTEIYKKVHDAGLLLQVYCSGVDELRIIDHITNLLGTTKGIAFICLGLEKDKAMYEQYLEKYNVPK